MNYVGFKERTRSSSEGFRFNLAQREATEEEQPPSEVSSFTSLDAKQKKKRKGCWYLLPRHTNTSAAPKFPLCSLLMTSRSLEHGHASCTPRQSSLVVFKKQNKKTPHRLNSTCPAIGPFLRRYCRFLRKVFLLSCSLHGGILADAVCSVN